MSTEQTPLYRAVGVLQGILSESEGFYSLTIGERSIPASVSKRIKLWLNGLGADCLDTEKLWRTYPRTDPDGSLRSVQLVSLANSDEPQLLTIQGKAIENDGKIKVWIHRNDPKQLERSKSFYLTLVGSLDIKAGSFVRITAIVNNGFLLAISGEKLADAPKPIRNRKKLVLKSKKPIDTKVKSKLVQKRKLEYVSR